MLFEHSTVELLNLSTADKILAKLEAAIGAVIISFGVLISYISTKNQIIIKIKSRIYIILLFLLKLIATFFLSIITLMLYILIINSSIDNNVFDKLGVIFMATIYLNLFCIAISAVLGSIALFISSNWNSNVVAVKKNNGADPR